MKTIQRLWAAFALLLVAAVPLAAQAQERTAIPSGPWLHEPSGTTFPDQIGGASRGNTATTFDEAGIDVAVGYSLKNDDGVLILTLYVYPPYGGLDCAESFSDAQVSINKYRGVRKLSQGSAPSPSGKSMHAATHARYAIPAGGMNPNYPALVSDLYVHCSPGDEWLVKYRASWTGSEETFPDVFAMLREIDWPEKLK
ncbi:hypothetical protein [Erythrobacter sp. HKB08]|uniref:hypothetical protein n=1 Tax=Erythrobacter sp. HKB08 TaxID=2502843 RepID=UPI0010092410|nr:hypothetical protein [Erythrobacter sp. HKB08]